MLKRVGKPSRKHQVVLSERGYEQLRKHSFARNMTQGRYIEWMMGQVRSHNLPDQAVAQQAGQIRSWRK